LDLDTRRGRRAGGAAGEEGDGEEVGFDEGVEDVRA
jgi:hypothetical protein